MQNGNSFVTLKNIQAARQALDEQGHLVLPQGYSAEACQEIIRYMDGHQPDQRTEVNYGGTELRIWDAHKRTPALQHFMDQCDVFLSCLQQTDMQGYTLLAIRNRALPAGDTVNMLGRWHIDSFRRMLKVFLFLTDTSEKTGPFEFIPGTHSKAFKARMILSGFYFQPKDVFSKTRAYQKLDDNRVGTLASKGYQSVPMLCKAGTILVMDTSAIHRARPCLEGARYALTAYYR